MDVPRTRYRVVERGRRLVVVDSWHGDAPVAPRAAEPRAMPPRTGPPPIEAPHASDSDSRGHRILTTRAWYDASGPRRIVLTDAGEEKLKGLWLAALVALFIAAVATFLFWPLLLLIPFLLARPSARQGFRTAAATFLDGINDK